MRVTDVRINGIENPIGFRTGFFETGKQKVVSL